MSFTIDYKIGYTDRRCGNCSRFYAYEGIAYVECPWCSRREVLQLREKLARAARVESGLRSALKSRKARKLLPRETSR